MKSRLLIGLVVVLTAMCSGVSFAGSIATPPQIMMPYGSDVVTEVYISDDDLLKVIKGFVPMIGDLAKGGLRQNVEAVVGQQAGTQGPNVSAVLDTLDLKPLSEAIEGVKSIRILVANYPGKVQKKELLSALDSGAKKIGTFKRIISDVQFTNGVVAVYAQEQNKGYLAYMYEPKSKTLYAGRLVGFLDIQKIISWGMELATKTMTAPPTPTETTTEPSTTPAPETPN